MGEREDPAGEVRLGIDRPPPPLGSGIVRTLTVNQQPPRQSTPPLPPPSPLSLSPARPSLPRPSIYTTAPARALFRLRKLRRVSCRVVCRVFQFCRVVSRGARGFPGAREICPARGSIPVADITGTNIIVVVVVVVRDPTVRLRVDRVHRDHHSGGIFTAVNISPQPWITTAGTRCRNGATTAATRSSGRATPSASRRSRSTRSGPPGAAGTPPGRTCTRPGTASPRRPTCSWSARTSGSARKSAVETSGSFVSVSLISLPLPFPPSVLPPSNRSF